MRRAAGEIARALRDHHERHAEQRGAQHQPVVGIVNSIGSGAPGFAVTIGDSGFVLDADDLLVSQAVAQYDQDYGLKVGDSLSMVPLANGDYIAVGVLTGTEATKRKTSGGINGHSGAPGPSDGDDGDFSMDPATGAIYGPKAAGVWPASPLPVGGGSGARYTYSSDTALTDPGTGKMKFNSLTLASITSVRISETDRDGNNLAAWLATFDDSSTTAHRGTLFVTKDGAPSSILILDVTGALADSGAWDSFTVAVLASGGAFADGDFLRVAFMRTGDAGAAGTAGAAGATGATGPTGPAGPSGGAPLAYAEITSNVTVSGTSAAQTTVVTAPSFTADGTSAVWVEFFTPEGIAAASDVLAITIWEGGTQLDQIAQLQPATLLGEAVYARRKFTPAAGTRTYQIRAFRVTSNGTVTAGVGGAAAFAPAFIRVTNDNNAGPTGPQGATGPTGIPGPPGAGGVAIGALFDWPGPARSIPPLYLACFGQSVLRASFPELFSALCPVVAGFTVTLASPGVFTTGASHGFAVGDSVFLTTTGVLPTGLNANTIYYVMTVPTGTSFTLGTTRSIVAASGIATVTTAVNTSGSQSGLHSVFHSPHGVADATHFNIPDYRGRDGIGLDTMGGSPASTLLWTPVGGLKAGESLHTLVLAEIPSFLLAAAAVPTASPTINVVQAAGGSGINITGGSDGPHNNVQPGILVNKIIFAGPLDPTTADIHSFLLMGV